MKLVDSTAQSLSSAAICCDPTQRTGAQLNPKLVHAAHQFEASLMQELLAPLQRDSMSSADGENDGGSENAMSTFAGEAMARAISDRGGFGIATQLIKHFEKCAPSSQSQP